MEAFLLDCPNYGAYLDRYITKADRRYLYSFHLQRKTVELNFRGNTTIYSPEEFLERKKQTFKHFYPQARKSEYSLKNYLTMDPLIAALAVRLKLNQQKLISTIIFLRTHNKSGMEVSGFIDYEDSVRRWTENSKNAMNWEAVFQEAITLRPRPMDLSYLDWHTGRVCYNNSANYVAIHNADGLSFMYRGDHKMICVGKNNCSSNFAPTSIFSEKYGYVVLYDHVVRKKN